MATFTYNYWDYWCHSLRSWFVGGCYVLVSLETETSCSFPRRASAKVPRPRRDRDVEAARPRRDRDVRDFVRDETETRRRVGLETVSRPRRRDRDHIPAICILTGYVNAKINKSGIYRPKMLWKTEDGGHRSWSQSNSLPSTEVKWSEHPPDLFDGLKPSRCMFKSTASGIWVDNEESCKSWHNYTNNALNGVWRACLVNEKWSGNQIALR